MKHYAHHLWFFNGIIFIIVSYLAFNANKVGLAWVAGLAAVLCFVMSKLILLYI